MSAPFRNTDKFRLYPANHVTSIIENADEAEAAVRELDEAGFGENLWYARGEGALNLLDVKGEHHGPLARLYRALQHLTEERDMLNRYEEKVKEGASFIAVQLGDPKDKRQVGGILHAHGSTYTHFLGRGTTESLP